MSKSSSGSKSSSKTSKSGKGSGSGPAPSGVPPAFTIVVATVTLIVSIVGTFLGAVPERDRNHMLYTVGLIGPSETPVPTFTPSTTPTPSLTPTVTADPTNTATPTLTFTPSLTPTPSQTPTPLPTPLEGAPAGDDEIVAVVARFTGNESTQRNVVNALRDAAEEVGAIRVIPIAHAIETPEEAKRIRDIYRATLVVYGWVEQGGVTVNYDVVETGASYQVGGVLRAAATDVGNFDVFLFSGMDVNYVVGLTLGQLYAVDGNYLEAIRALTLAERALDPARLEELQAHILYLYRGIVWLRMGQDTRALEDFDRSLALDAQFPLTYYNRAVTYASEGDYKRGIHGLTRAIELDPEFADAYFLRGLYRWTLSQTAEAIADYSSALALDPEFPGANYQRGLAHAFEEDYQAALDDFTAALRLNAQDAAIYLERGHAHMALGHVKQALADFAEATRLDPENVAAYVARGDLWTRLGEYHRAIADYTHAIKLDPSGLAYLNRAGALYALGRAAEALADFVRYQQHALSINEELRLVMKAIRAELRDRTRDSDTPSVDPPQTREATPEQRAE